MVVLRMWICLLATLVALPPNTASIVFERRPGVTCGVRGGDAHLVWNYDDSADTVGLIRWIDGTEDTGTSMGTYVPSSSNFTAFGSYAGKISFANDVYTAGFKGAKLTFNGLEVSDAGTYSTVFQANANTFDTSVLEVAEHNGLGTWEICVDGTCNVISDPLTLSASADVKVKFTKGGGLTCDMDIDVKPSVGDSFRLVVPEGPGATAEHTLADAATLLAAGSLSIDLVFGKNREVFYNHTIAQASISVTSGGQSPSPAQAAAIAFGVIFIIAGIILVAVILFNGLTLPGKVCVGVGVGICVIGCILVVVFVAALTYLTSAEVAGACVAVCVVTVVILIVIVVVWYKMKVI